MSDKYQALRDAVKEADDDYGLSLYRDETAQLVELLAERDALEAELAVCREAIEVCLDVAERLPSDDDGAAAVRSCTLRRLNEAVGKAVPRLMMERPEGQKLYGLNYMEMWGRIKALEDRAQALLTERDALREDAERYRWLRSRRSLDLRTGGTHWTASDGTRFVSTHYLAADDTQHAPAPSLDAAIDAAMGAWERRMERGY